MDFPDLAPRVGEEPTWILLRDANLRGAEPQELLGQHVVTEGIQVRLFRTEAGFQIRFDDTGTFDIQFDRREILWAPGSDPDLEKVRADVVGPVLATALHAAGRFCLHSSAVALPKGAMAFVGPKHHGKSTLAMAMVAAGARLVTDDSLPVDMTPPVHAEPGVHSVRVWEDSHDSVEIVARKSMKGAGGKCVFADLPSESLMTERSPLSAIYVLRPIKSEPGGRAALRMPASPMHAALTLVQNAKLGPLLGASEAPLLLEIATRLSELVPIYVLGVVRDYARLGEVVDQLMDWHGAPVPPSHERDEP